MSNDAAKDWAEATARARLSLAGRIASTVVPGGALADNFVAAEVAGVLLVSILPRGADGKHPWTPGAERILLACENAVIDAERARGADNA